MIVATLALNYKSQNHQDSELCQPTCINSTAVNNECDIQYITTG